MNEDIVPSALCGRIEMVKSESDYIHALRVEILEEGDYFFRLWGDAIIPDETRNYLLNTEGIGYVLIGLAELRPLIDTLQKIERMIEEAD